MTTQGNGHNSDDIMRLTLNGMLLERGFGAHAISRERWERWPDKLVEAVRRGLPPDKDYDDDDHN